MAKCLKFNATYALSTSPDPRHHTTLLNADVLNCYVMLKFLIYNKLSDDRISTH